MILSSSVMAKRRPTFFDVASPNLRARRVGEGDHRQAALVSSVAHRPDSRQPALFSRRATAGILLRQIHHGRLTAPTPPGPCTARNVGFASALSYLPLRRPQRPAPATMRSSPWRTTVTPAYRLVDTAADDDRLLNRALRAASFFRVSNGQGRAIALISMPSVSTDLPVRDRLDRTCITQRHGAALF
jgi:hypothetical protein